MTNTSAAEKTAKPKGPIRTGVVVPTLLLAGLIYAYFAVFFDLHLRKGMEFALTRIHGAEVNIASVHTSFLRASFRLRGLEVTDKEKPERNLVQVGDIHFQALWDALLRAKLVIEDASVLDIQAYAPRRKPGFVLPPPPPADPGAGVLAQVQNQVLEQTRSRLNENFLGDIAEMAAGADPKAQLAEIQGSLKAEARAKELEKELEAKKAEWQKRIAELPKGKDIQELEAKIKALDLKGGNPIEIAGKLKKAKEIVDEAKAKVRQVEEAQGKLSGDLGAYTRALADLEKLAQQDVADLQKRLKIPSVDPKEFSTQLFLSLVEKRLSGVRKYIELARKYMPPKQTAEQKAAAAQRARERELVPPARGEGRSYHFPVTTGYPLFWLKKAAVSSEITQSEWAGKLSGEILDVTTSPSQLRRPTKIHLAGDFPKQKIHGLDFLATIDHTGEKARESIEARVAGFPVLNQLFSDSPAVRLGLKEASGSGSLQATLVDMSVQMRLQSRFSQASWDFDAKNAVVKEILGGVLRGIPLVTMNAEVGGSWDRFSISINSNLGTELSNGFQKQLQAKLGEAKAKLDAFVNEKIGPNRKKLQELLGGLSGGPGKLLSGQKDEMSRELAKAQGAAAAPAGGGSPAEQGKKLLKGFGF